ncbi:MAG: MoaD/ThiS family protein [Anaerolineae bacterium]|nr:MoaD/ThiS family protein [Anaerolineae bacterium]
MKINVILYGVLKQDAGVKRHTLDLSSDPATVRAAVSELAAQIPALAARLETVAYVIDDEIVDPDTILHDGDQLALLPPVSGG